MRQSWLLASYSQGLAGKVGRRARVVSADFGFETQSRAIAFVTKLRGRFPKAMCQIRTSQRLTALIEVKVRSFEGLESFAWTLLNQQETTAPEISSEQAKASIFLIPVEVHRQCHKTGRTNIEVRRSLLADLSAELVVMSQRLQIYICLPPLDRSIIQIT